MASPDVTGTRAGSTSDDRADGNSRSRSSEVIRLIGETKTARKTTELAAYVVVLVGLLIAGLVTKAGDGHDDRLMSKDVWLFAVILTVGYMISRGLAKSGTAEPLPDDDDLGRRR